MGREAKYRKLILFTKRSWLRLCFTIELNTSKEPRTNSKSVLLENTRRSSP
jgi:hypothetical protein